MKYIILGLFIFGFWSWGSIDWYVCKIKGLCADDAVVVEIEQTQETDTVISVLVDKEVTPDTISVSDTIKVEVSSPGQAVIYFEFRHPRSVYRITYDLS